MMMMMMGEDLVHAPPWAVFDDSLPVSGVSVGGDYLLNESALAALQRYLPSNDTGVYEDSDQDGELSADAPVDAYSCDEFRMYEFKVRRCARGRSHDWTECPYAHPGEKARRRDPRKYHYSGITCPEFRKGNCKRGDACEYAHGVFECWLHPARYRTQPCKDGTACRRRVCFFAHTPDQLRVLPQQPQSPPNAGSAAPPESYDGSPLRRQGLEAYFAKSAVATSAGLMVSQPVSPMTESPPVSPSGGALRRASWPGSGSGSVMNEVMASLRQLQLSKVNSMPNPSWGVGVGGGGGGCWGGAGSGVVFGSPRGAAAGFSGGFCSLPSTPTGVGGGVRWRDSEEEAPTERVESGRALRAKLFERLSKESGMENPGSTVPAPDVGWVSELVK